jgi:uncharacterized protein (TIGR03083 family)
MGVSTRATTTADAASFHAAMTERLVRLGRSLSPEQWRAPSLCDGWRACDVYGHMTYGGVTPLHRVLPTLLLRYRGNLTRGSRHESIRYADAHSQAEVVDAFERSSHHPVGIGKRIKPHELHLDHVIHELDVRRPLGLPTEFGADELRMALDAAVRVKSPLFAPRARAGGLRLVATDVDWSAGEPGAVAVEGPAEDLLLALGGRPAGLAALHGDGVALLAQRVGAG